MRNIVLSLLLLLSIGCGQQDKQNSPAKKDADTGWKELNEPTYSVQYPSKWELREEKETNGGFILLSPLDSGDKFQENVNLVIQPVGKDVDLDKYTEFSEKQVKDNLPNAVFIESKRIKNDGPTHHKFIFSGDYQVYHLQWEQYFWIQDNKTYLLTFTVEKDKFEKFLETGEKILNSFKLK